jgi:biotin-(acetyl-CoA carboxylase) ligase
MLAGKPVQVIDGANRLDGVALGIDDTGALRVEHAGGGVRHWHGGEVSLRAA